MPLNVRSTHGAAVTPLSLESKRLNRLHFWTGCWYLPQGVMDEVHAQMPRNRRPYRRRLHPQVHR
jgi:hypothetical protein